MVKNVDNVFCTLIYLTCPEPEGLKKYSYNANLADYQVKDDEIERIFTKNC